MWSVEGLPARLLLFVLAVGLSQPSSRPVLHHALLPRLLLTTACVLLPALPAGYDNMRPSSASARASSSSSASASPCHAVLLRWGGLMSVLDLARGAELVLADEVRRGGQLQHQALILCSNCDFGTP